MTVIKNFINGAYNENWLARMTRAGILAGVAAAAVAIANVLPSVDIPGNYDVTIIAVATPVLIGLDKWLRGRAAGAL